ncbi:profilin [Leucosporidium creatinivorum]|uniref:Profilin n=1 Tax=Leucosporidium creatinivorum TaxID=106004 RepID=A0A1Y2CFL0_9BASI|nr:profilin [Leucosporidium creatinivorum]
MSWQTYVDSNLLGTGKIAKAAILGQQGGVWAQSAGYELSPEEQAAIVAAFSDPTNAQGNGVRAQGVKFMTIKADDRSVYGKKLADGIICVKTTQAVLVAEYVTPTTPGEATKIVEELGDYLLSVGF